MARIEIAVTGATGALGGRVARGLADRGIPQRLIVRNAARAPVLAGAEVAEASYQDRPAMVAGLRGIETVFFVSGFESQDRLERHKAAIDAFVEAGVQRVIYTSFLNAAPDSIFTLARHHYHTEVYLEAAGLRFAALRNSQYADTLPLMVVDGVIRGPAGTGRFAPVTRDDIADVAVALLLDSDHPTARYDLTGPDLLTMEDVADALSSATGRSVTFVNETREEAYASRAGYDASAFEIEGWVTSYESIARGEMDLLSDAVERLAGHPAKSLRSFLQQQVLTNP